MHPHSVLSKHKLPKDCLQEAPVDPKQPSTSTQEPTYHWSLDQLYANKALDEQLEKHYYHKFHKGRSSSSSGRVQQQFVKVWSQDEETKQTQMVPTKATPTHMDLLVPLLYPCEDVLEYSRQLSPKRVQLDTMTDVDKDKGHTVNWDLRVTNLLLRVKLLLGALGQVQQQLPVRWKVEAEIMQQLEVEQEDAAGSSSSHSTLSAEQRRQYSMHRVFLFPAWHTASSSDVKGDKLKSCCMEWDKGLVKKAKGISSLKAGYLLVHLGYRKRQLTADEKERTVKGGKPPKDPTLPVMECAHRLVCWSKHGPPPSNTRDVSHTCNNKKCLNPWHLEWASHFENLMYSQTPTKTQSKRTYSM